MKNSSTMKQINVETATREQLVDFIRRMHPQLQREQERVKELESQISGFQEFIHEKNAEIRELRQQSDRLTEKSASDEETIGALIKQMEEMRLEQAPALTAYSAGSAAATSNAPPRGKPVEQAAGKSHASPSDNGGGDRTPEVTRSAETARSSGDADRRPSRTPPPSKDSLENAMTQLKSQNAAAASSISSKTEEIAVLENKMRELMEVNAFYSAIVAQHDQEEKARMGQKLVHSDRRSEDDVAELRQEVERLHFHVSNLDLHEEKMQRIIKTVEAEKAVLRRENELLKRNAVQLEAEMAEMTRDYMRARRSLASAASRQSATVNVQLTYADDDAQSSRATSAPQQPLPRGNATRTAFSSAEGVSQQPERRTASMPNTAASRVSPLSHDGRPGAIGAAGASPTPSTHSSAASRSRFNFRSLRPIRVRNPDAHEKDLLDRIHLYEEQFAQMELFEADRQRSFDEMERNRAEMFVAMNAQLEKQRKEIHRLRRLHEDASLDSSLTARPSHNQSVASIVNREDEDTRSSLRRHNSHSPEERCLTAVPTSTQSLHNVDSLNAMDDADGAVGTPLIERETVVQRSTHQRRPQSTSAAVIADAQEDVKCLEKTARLGIWQEATDELVHLLASFYAATVQHCTAELASCSLKLIGEREALTTELESLQRRNEELEAQAMEWRAAAPYADGVTETGSAACASAAAEETQACLAGGEDDAALFLKQKALSTAYLTMDAYNSVLEQYAALLHELGSDSAMNGDAQEFGVELRDEVTRDLEEVRTALKSLKQAPATDSSRDEPPATSSAAPHLTEMRRGSEALQQYDTTETPEDKLETSDRGDGAAEASRSSSVQPTSYEGPTATAADYESPTSATSGDHAAAGEDGEDEAEPYAPPDLYDGDASAISVSQDCSRDSSPAYDAAPSCEQESAMPSDNCTVTTDDYAAEHGADGESLAHVSADEADGTATSQFADCIEKDDGTRRSSSATSANEDVDQEGEEAGTEEAGSVAAPRDEDDAGAGANELLASEEGEASMDANVVENNNDLDSPGEAAVEQPDQRARVDEIDARDEAAGEAENSAVELHDSDDSDVVSAASQLEVTEAEEADFLAQLQKEMEKDGANSDGAAADDVMAGAEEEKEQEEDQPTTSPEEPHLARGSESGDEMQEKEEERQDLDISVDGADAAAEKAMTSTSSEPPAHGETAKDDQFDFNAVMDDTSCAASSSAADHDSAAACEQPRRERSSEVDAVISDDASTASLASPSTASSSVRSTSPSMAAAGSVVQRAENAEHKPAVDFPVTSYTPPKTPPSMVAPASLDVLFGGHAPAAFAAPPPPPPSDPSLFAARTAVEQSSLPPPSVVADAQKPASPFMKFSAGSGIPTLSPNSMFVTPPRPAPSRSFFTRSPSGGNYLPPQAESKKAQGGESSSSDDDFEPGFDPFA